jgi:D-alanyl-D-alanine carboxypeptidase
MVRPKKLDSGLGHSEFCLFWLVPLRVKGQPAGVRCATKERPIGKNDGGRMLSRGVGARDGLRWGVFSLVATVSLLAITTDSSDARSRRKQVESGETSKSETVSAEPRYSDIVVDGNSGAILHASNPDGLRHPASLTKVMTLYLLFEQLEAGKFKLDSPLEVSEHAAVQSPTKLGLKDGQSIKVEDAIKGIVTRSANDAAVVVAENVGGSEDAFARLMTHKAQSLGMTHTVYRNASGLPNDEQITTARDQALLGRAIQERFPRYYKYFSTRSFEFRGESIGNHNHLLGSIDGVDGIKTGYISASGFNIITSLHRDNRYLVAVVFGGSSAGSRDERVRELIHQHLAEAAVQRTVASLIAEADKPETKPASQSQVLASAASVPVTVTVAKPEAKPDSKSAAKGKPETKSAPPAYALASAGSLLVTLPAKNEAKIEPKIEPKTEPKPEAKAAQTYALASATSVPITLTSKSDPGATTTVQVPRWSATNSVAAPRVAPAVGSEDPIHPVQVKTVLVRPGIAAQPAAVGPLQPSNPAEPPAQAAAAPAPAPATTPAAPAVAQPAPAKPAALPFPPPGTRPSAVAGLPAHVLTTASVAEPAAPAAPAAAAPQQTAPPVAPLPATTVTRAPAPAPQPHAGWIIQVGAFAAEDEAKQRLSSVQNRASKYLSSADAFTETVSKGESVWYRARFAGLGKEQAEAACNYLKHNDVDCMTIKN